MGTGWVMDTDIIQKGEELNARRVGAINWIGLQTLVGKEVGRFINVYSQTIVAPVVTMLLYYAIFALAFGGVAKEVGGIPYLQFLAPGLIMMTMVQNAFANTSSSVVIAKIQGNIVDVLMPPISPVELYIGYTVGGLLRGIVVGVVCAITLSLTAGITIHSLPAILAFGVLGNLMLSSLGLAAGLWSEKFDHIAAVTNFIVMPMTFLSGTFYSVEQLPPFWQTLVHYNPFFHMIDGFRYGFIGHADGSLMWGIVVLVIINIFLAGLTLQLVRTGYKIKH